MRYRSRLVLLDGWDNDTSATADEVIDQDQAPEWSGLLDASGNRLYRQAERVSFGFHPSKVKP